MVEVDVETRAGGEPADGSGSGLDIETPVCFAPKAIPDGDGEDGELDAGAVDGKAGDVGEVAAELGLFNGASG